MSTEKRTKVTLDLRSPIAEKLRAMCHARGETASMLIDRWILQANERGEIVPPKPAAPPTADDFFRDIFRGVKQ